MCGGAEDGFCTNVKGLLIVFWLLSSFCPTYLLFMSHIIPSYSLIFVTIKIIIVITFDKIYLSRDSAPLKVHWTSFWYIYGTATSFDCMWSWWRDRVSGAERSAQWDKGEGPGEGSIWQRVTMKVDADAREAPAAPAATPGTPIASNTESPVSSLDGLLV